MFKAVMLSLPGKIILQTRSGAFYSILTSRKLMIHTISSVSACRLDCYRCITETLDYLLSTSMSHPQAPSVPRSPGPPPVQDPNRLTNAEAEQYVSKRSIFRTLFKSHHENKITFWQRIRNKKGIKLS